MDRKEEHLRLARQQHQKNLVNDFDEIRFISSNFPKVDVSKVDLTTSFAKRTFKAPLFINAMTGGTPRAYEINKKLAQVAKDFQVPLALGSFSAALKNPDLLSTYTVVKEVNPMGFLWANLSADVSLETMEKTLHLSKADGLQLHLNLPQEIVMPEGDRIFSNWLENIHQAIKSLAVPIMVKETGFGMTKETFALLQQAGVSIIDVGGRGGTSFTKIENSRRKTREMAYLDDFGLSTVESLLEGKNFSKDLFITATGGVRTPFDVVKALALGAKSVGLAGSILPLIMEKEMDEILAYFQLFLEDLQLLYALLGAENTLALRQVPLLFSPQIINYAHQRDIDLSEFQRK